MILYDSVDAYIADCQNATLVSECACMSARACVTPLSCPRAFLAISKEFGVTAFTNSDFPYLQCIYPGYSLGWAFSLNINRTGQTLALALALTWHSSSRPRHHARPLALTLADRSARSE